MSWKIGDITLPFAPRRAIFKHEADLKTVPLLKRLPLILHLGPKAKVLALDGVLAEFGKTAADLESEYLIPLSKEVIKPFAAPRVIADDNQTAFWTLNPVAAAVNELGSPWLSDDPTAYFGKHSLGITTPTGTTYARWYISKLFDEPIDLSRCDFLSFACWHNYGVDVTWRVQLTDKGGVDPSNKYYVDVTVSPTDLAFTRYVKRLDEFTKIGDVDWSRIDFIWCEHLTANLVGLFRFDRFCAGIGVLVQAPHTRYDGVYVIKKFDYQEIGGRVAAFTYSLELWNVDDYY